jgi:Uma2 family endonuclease
MVTQPHPKFWTYDDLCRLPDDGKRYEIIAGELYTMPSPNMQHGEIVANLLHRVFWPVVEPLGGRVYTAPIDLFLLDTGPVQPDVFVLLADQSSLKTARGVEGPPALIVEVLSPSNPERDRIVKRALYARAGVPEYWLVSPEAAIVEVLTLVAGQYQTHCRVAGDEPLTSPTFPRLHLPTSTVFQW